ncbi:hypothetical protein IWQ56_005464, partial [Coemansia nantahalensis]
MVMSTAAARKHFVSSLSPIPQSTSASLADGSTMRITHMLPQAVLTAGPTRGRFDLVVAPVRYDIIVGLPWIAWANAAVDWDCRRLHTRYGEIAEHCDETLAAPDADDVINSMDMKVLAEHSADPLDGAVSEYLIHQLDAHAADDLPADEPLPTPPAHPKAAQLALEFADCLRDELPDELPPRRPQDPLLELRHDAELRNRPLYRMSQDETAALRVILDKLLARGQIYETDAPFASPAFMIRKKLGGHRLLVDMRQINAALKDMSWP